MKTVEEVFNLSNERSKELANALFSKIEEIDLDQREDLVFNDVIKIIKEICVDDNEKMYLVYMIGRSENNPEIS